MVEQRPFKPLVGGSSPPAPTKNSMGIRTFQKLPEGTPVPPALHSHEPHKYAHGGDGGESDQKRFEQLSARRRLPASGVPPVFPRYVSRLGVSFDT